MLVVNYAFRAIPTWPHPTTGSRRWHPFKSSWDQTLRLLERELVHLKGSSVIIAAGFRERDIRLDGMPRGSAAQPSHPGVEISFDTAKLGRGRRLVYATDVCAHWQDNVRSIALGLESLRAVDRYGITRRGEQYAGWLELTTGADDGPSIERGRALISEAGSLTEAIKATHPDAGGERVDFESVQLARAAGAT